MKLFASDKMLHWRGTGKQIESGPSEWRARERELITGTWQRSPQRLAAGSGADPLFRGSGVWGSKPFSFWPSNERDKTQNLLNLGLLYATSDLLYLTALHSRENERCAKTAN